MKEKFEFWYAQQITNQPERGTSVYDVQVSTKLLVIKPIHAKQLLALYDYLRNSSDIKGFAMVGIKNALVMELPLEDPSADLDA